MAVNNINTDYFQSRPLNFQEGLGLFQFTSDYSLLGIDGDFAIGIETGTLSAYSSGTPSVTLKTGLAAKAADYYNIGLYLFMRGLVKVNQERLLIVVLQVLLY